MFIGHADCLVALYSLGTLHCFGNIISSDLLMVLFDPFVKLLWHASNPYPIHVSHTSSIRLVFPSPLPFTSQLTTLGVCLLDQTDFDCHGIVPKVFTLDILSIFFEIAPVC